MTLLEIISFIQQLLLHTLDLLYTGLGTCSSHRPSGKTDNWQAVWRHHGGVQDGLDNVDADRDDPWPKPEEENLKNCKARWEGELDIEKPRKLDIDIAKGS